MNAAKGQALAKIKLELAAKYDRLSKNAGSKGKSRTFKNSAEKCRRQAAELTRGQ